MNQAMGSTHAAGTSRLFILVWIMLLVITGIEVFLAYERLAVPVMLGILMSLSMVKAYLIISYFMHLRYEKPSLAVTLIPPLVLVLCLLLFFFPDSLRLLHLRPS